MPSTAHEAVEPSNAAASDRQQAESLQSRHLHFVGIGGCGMSGLAGLLAQLGAKCSGSDRAASATTDALVDRGIEISFDTSLPASCMSEMAKIDEVVISAAIPEDHPTVLAANNLGTPVTTYAEMLGRVQIGRLGVSIAGTHGKSTTTAMLCYILLACDLDPSFIIGATCPQTGGGSRVGQTNKHQADILVCEACEFNRSFHHHRPTIGLINNLEEDHLDIYGSLEAIVEAFRGFAQLIPTAQQGGLLLIAHEDAHRNTVTPGLSCKVETFGFNPEATYQVVYDNSVQRVGLLSNGRWICQWTNQMPGAHNALNASAAVILAHQLGADWEEAAHAMSDFKGLDRRTNLLGKRSLHDGEVIIYDDYGHHPTEIEKTLRAVRNVHNPSRLICVFQPHQHSRTRFLLDHFAQSFSLADEVIVPEIYFVRDSEIERHKISARDLVDRLRDRGVKAQHLYPFDAIVEYLVTTTRGGELVVIMGAGPVDQVAHDFLKAP
ncbi:MAG: UDP-N-acetylmuramate--L-alanine ligase [Phycisphaerales bacterium]|nr:UDP-N-acetylmuramate--L-alanine ligase [Phycisphaerales bacterium]